MLFLDILNTKTQELQPEFDKLFVTILDRQSHDGDLLLINVNGFYYPKVYEWTNVENKNPYMIGLNTEGHSDYWHSKFINNYRKTSISEISFSEYSKKFKWSKETADEITQLTESETTSIQLEMLIYLKIWEADLFIKKLYQLSSISQGEPYDWHFKIAESNRDKQSTGSRDEILRKKVRDRWKDEFPKIYAAINKAYSSQLRNSIAHSKYSFMSRFIHLNNHIKADPAAQTEVLTFNDWIDMFHDTMIIYNQLTRLSILIDKFYSEAAKKNDLLFEIRINRKDPEEKTVYSLLKYRPEWNDWRFKN
jgi:hypothetical protein